MQWQRKQEGRGEKKVQSTPLTTIKLGRTVWNSLANNASVTFLHANLMVWFWKMLWAAGSAAGRTPTAASARCALCSGLGCSWDTDAAHFQRAGSIPLKYRTSFPK